MAGLLPGVDCPRRRRHHRGGAGLLSDPPSMVVGDWSRRSSFYTTDLFMTSHEEDRSSAATWMQARGRYSCSTDDVKLGGVAREAKARLDAKLRSKLKSDLRRSSFGANGQSSMQAAMRTLQTEVFGMTKGSGGEHSGGPSRKTVKWPETMRWKSAEQEECAVCLESFRVGENLLNLQCAHRFHTRCLVPWLDNNSCCPCCRTAIAVAIDPTTPI